MPYSLIMAGSPVLPSGVSVIRSPRCVGALLFALAQGFETTSIDMEGCKFASRSDRLLDETFYAKQNVVTYKQTICSCRISVLHSSTFSGPVFSF